NTAYEIFTGLEFRRVLFRSNYTQFFLMLGGSFIAMYITMYLNTYAIDHVYFSLTRFYMTCLGIAAMAVIMLSLMLKMYKNKKKRSEEHRVGKGREYVVTTCT